MLRRPKKPLHLQTALVSHVVPDCSHQYGVHRAMCRRCRLWDALYWEPREVKGSTCHPNTLQLVIMDTASRFSTKACLGIINPFFFQFLFLMLIQRLRGHEWISSWGPRKGRTPFNGTNCTEDSLKNQDLSYRALLGFNKVVWVEQEGSYQRSLKIVAECSRCKSVLEVLCRLKWL